MLEDCATAESVIACCGLDWETLRPAELHTILGILSQPNRPPGILLQRAVQHHLVYKALPPLPSKQAPGHWSPVHIVHGLMLPDAEHPGQDNRLPHESELQLRLEYKTIHGKESCNTAAHICHFSSASGHMLPGFNMPVCTQQLDRRNHMCVKALTNVHPICGIACRQTAAWHLLAASCWQAAVDTGTQGFHFAHCGALCKVMPSKPLPRGHKG